MVYVVVYCCSLWIYVLVVSGTFISFYVPLFPWNFVAGGFLFGLYIAFCGHKVGLWGMLLVGLAWIVRRLVYCVWFWAVILLYV